MQKAYLITATAESDDSRVGIAQNDRIYIGRHYWYNTISNAIWFDSREAAIKFIYGTSHVTERNLLGDRVKSSENWQIVEFTYDTVVSDVTQSEYEAALRENVLSRLSSEERRVLGL